MAAVARRKCSANLQLPAPQEVQWKPPLRQAATTLGNTRETDSVHYIENFPQTLKILQV